MKTLFLIPARRGSKGIVKKNVRIIAGKPLVIHSLILARRFADDHDICISTDDPEVIKSSEKEGYHIPFIRPEELANDTAGMYEVMLHALDFYAQQGVQYNRLVLLQPTSPFRLPEHVQNALDLYNQDLDMVVSVVQTDANPYFVLFEENLDGMLVKSKTGVFASRQECPKVWELNGAVYVINVTSLRERKITEFTRIRKMEMDKLHSVDLDTELDWKLASLINEEQGILPL